MAYSQAARLEAKTVLKGAVPLPKGLPYFGMVGNGETAALVSPTGSIDWLCLPRLDSMPVMARALDPMRGGRLSLFGSDEAIPIEQRYIDKTNVLVTRLQSALARWTFIDWMPWGKASFVRRVEIENFTEDELRLSLGVDAFLTQTGSLGCFSVREGEAHGFAWDSGTLLIFLSGEKSGGWPSWQIGPIAPGDRWRGFLYIGWGDNETEALQALQGAHGASLAEEIVFWQNWVDRARRPKTTRELITAYERSLLALKLLVHHRSGAPLAALTSSFPRSSNGDGGHDERLCWIRHAYGTAMAFDAAGLHTEARRIWDFLMGCQSSEGHWAHPLYTLDGGITEEVVVDDLASFDGKHPVRLGSDDFSRFHLDSEGSILHGLWAHYQQTRDLDYLESCWPRVQQAAEWIAKHWRRNEHGIWGFHRQREMWVYGKTLCAAGLISASAIASELGHYQEAERWESAAERVTEFVLQKGYSSKREAFVQTCDDEACLDISVLALEFYGLLDPDDERMVQTVEAIKALMRRGKGFSRFESASMGCFLATLWLARHCLNAGDAKGAKKLMEGCLEAATNLGLMSESFDEDLRQWGNFPYALSHSEMVRVILEYSRLLSGSDRPGVADFSSALVSEFQAGS